MEKIEPKKVRCNMEKLEPKNAYQEHESGHHRRRSTGSSAFSDSETVPNYLRATRGSCHDRCKSGFISEDEQVTKSSRAAMGEHFQKKKKKKSVVNLEAALDSITRTSKVSKKETNTSRAKPVISSSTAQQPRRSFSDFVNSRRQRFNEPNQFIGSDGRSDGLEMINDIRYTTLVKKNVRVLPERSSAVKGSRSRIPKKLDNTTTEKIRKTKAERQVNDVTLGFTDSLDSICDSSSDERTCQKEATTSELIQSEETSRCMGLTCNSEKQETDSSSDERTCLKETATSELVQSEETRGMGLTGNSEKQETDLTAKIKSKAISNELEDSDSSPRKLKFREGKVITEQEVENSTKKLNFRQGILTENQDSNIIVPGVSLRKTEIENPKSCPIKDTPTVHLRGLVVEEKNGSQGSYNSLIEETANKLSRTKSKVKALVGAFESVISLVDTNSQTSKRHYVPVL